MASHIPPRRLRLYATSLPALTLVLAAVMCQHPLIRVRLQGAVASVRTPRRAEARAQPLPDVSGVLAKDPKPGYSLPWYWQNALIKASPDDAKPTLLVYVGDCAGCINVDFTAYARQASERRVNFAFLTSAPEAEARRFAQAVKVEAGIVSDPKGDLRGALNAAWLPRCYLLSPEGKLLWLQKAPAQQYDPFADPTFPPR